MRSSATCAAVRRFPDFYVSVNVPPVMIGNGKILAMLNELGLVPCVDRLVCEVTERQALSSNT